MEKKYIKYFGANIARIIYCIGSVLACFGVFCMLFSHRGLGFLACLIGVPLFFITSAIQASDKDIDKLVSDAMESYKEEKIKGKVIGKETLDESKFSLFSGFIRDSGDVRFKSGRDGKLRTSRYYVTAISAERSGSVVFTTVYDIISGEVKDYMISTKDAESVEFTKEAVEFPHGNFFCRIKTLKEEASEALEFYLPADALADKLTATISENAKNEE